MPVVVLLRGGGDLASGVALRMVRCGLRTVITELPQPLVVRRLVSFAEAVYQGQATVEGVTALHVVDLRGAIAAMEQGNIPVLVDPMADSLFVLRHALTAATRVVLVDARMTKRPPEIGADAADLVIGLGPGFVAGENCHAAVETQRGHHLGRVIWQGAPQSDSGVPDPVVSYGAQRVLRAPADGVFQAHANIGDHFEAGQAVAEVAGQVVVAPFRGVLRGLLHPGLHVWQGLKVGDMDPRDDARYCSLVSDKSLAIGGGVLEAILSRPELRPYLWE
ncbi:MAG: EF2563 family selenium-dependent molybdenum hydroxylase system protein [Anaerolineales bacterium]|nr:EF2563 family selenium-dependent molybdenum hydroxylase system protein [Anaerolineales bacterium]